MNKKYKVKVPVKVARIEEINWVFECDSKEEVENLKIYIEEEELIALDPTYEEVVEIYEENLLEVYENDLIIDEN